MFGEMISPFLHIISNMNNTDGFYLNFILNKQDNFHLFGSKPFEGDFAKSSIKLCLYRDVEGTPYNWASCPCHNKPQNGHECQELHVIKATRKTDGK